MVFDCRLNNPLFTGVENDSSHDDERENMFNYQNANRMNQNKEFKEETNFKRLILANACMISGIETACYVCIDNKSDGERTKGSTVPNLDNSSFNTGHDTEVVLKTTDGSNTYLLMRRHVPELAAQVALALQKSYSLSYPIEIMESNVEDSDLTTEATISSSDNSSTGKVFDSVNYSLMKIFNDIVSDDSELNGDVVISEHVVNFLEDKYMPELRSCETLQGVIDKIPLQLHHEIGMDDDRLPHEDVMPAVYDTVSNCDKEKTTQQLLFSREKIPLAAFHSESTNDSCHEDELKRSSRTAVDSDRMSAPSMSLLSLVRTSCTLITSMLSKSNSIQDNLKDMKFTPSQAMTLGEVCNLSSARSRLTEGLMKYWNSMSYCVIVICFMSKTDWRDGLWGNDLSVTNIPSRNTLVRLCIYCGQRSSHSRSIT
jgi:hypothetical protein